MFRFTDYGPISTLSSLFLPMSTIFENISNCWVKGVKYIHAQRNNNAKQVKRIGERKTESES